MLLAPTALKLFVNLEKLVASALVKSTPPFLTLSIAFLKQTLTSVVPSCKPILPPWFLKPLPQSPPPNTATRFLIFSLLRVCFII